MSFRIALLRAAHYAWDRRHAWQLPRAFSPATLHHVIAGRRVPLDALRPGAPGDAAVDVSITFDVERDWGSAVRERRLTALEPFVRLARPWLARRGARATFFVEGGIVAEQPEAWLDVARDGHEVGLHGYHHESWGLDWFVDLESSPLVTEASGEELLSRAREAFDRAGLPPPRSFRAPNLVLDPRFVPLLWRHGIRVDSSAPAMKGARPVRSTLHGPADDPLVCVPVTTSIVPRLLRVGLLPYSRFSAFTLQNLLTMSHARLVADVEEVVRFQLARGQRPHVVLLAHPWEFVTAPPGAPGGLGRLGEDNFDHLGAALDALSTAFRVRYRTVLELGGRELVSPPPRASQAAQAPVAVELR